MTQDPFRRASLFVVAGLTLAGAALALPFSSASEDVSVMNPSDRGADGFGTILKVQSARAGSESVRIWQESLADLPEPSPRATLLVLGPSTKFSVSEAEAVARFLERGGQLFLADDVGLANSLLEHLPTETRISGIELIDLAFSRQPHFPVLYSLRPHPLTQGVDSLVANVASSVRPDPNATVIIASSDSSWLDRDADGLPGPGDRRGPHPVLTRERIGRGELVVLSDPSILSNQMIDVGANRFFAENLAEYATTGAAQVHVDETHREHRPFAILTGALPAASEPVRAAVLLSVLVLLAGVVLGRVAARRFSTWLAARRKQERGLVETVLERNPEWKEADLQRLVRHLMTHRRSEDRG